MNVRTPIVGLSAGLLLNVGAKAAASRIVAALKAVDRVATAGPFRPACESLAKYRIPEWYQDAQFGIFIQ